MNGPILPAQSLLVLGGARSGKSRYAQARTEQMGTIFAFMATAQPDDAEMEERIARHRADRDAGWITIEAPIDLPNAIVQVPPSADAVLVDCLTLWLSNLILAEKDIAGANTALERAIIASPIPIVLVANEVGLGIVPDNALARRFRDETGWLNQRLAQICAEVVLVTAGLPMALKSPPSP